MKTTTATTRIPIGRPRQLPYLKPTPGINEGRPSFEARMHARRPIGASLSPIETQGLNSLRKFIHRVGDARCPRTTKRLLVKHAPRNANG